MRRFSKGLAAWIFGLSLSVLMVSVWGRSVVVDTEELANSLSPLVVTDQIVDRFSTWLMDEVTRATGVRVGGDVAQAILKTSEGAAALNRASDAVIRAAATQDPNGGFVELGKEFVPAAPEIAAVLQGAGVQVSISGVEEFLLATDPLQVREPGSQPMVGPASPTAHRLGIAALLSSLLMLVSGTISAWLSSDRRKTFQLLLTRAGISAISFAVLLRIGSWATSPTGGRAPIAETVSLLAGSQWLVPLVLGIGFLGAAYLSVLRIKTTKGIAQQVFKSSAADPVKVSIED